MKVLKFILSIFLILVETGIAILLIDLFGTLFDFSKAESFWDMDTLIVFIVMLCLVFLALGFFLVKMLIRILSKNRNERR